MREKKDNLDKLIKEELEKEALRAERESEEFSDEEMSDDIKLRIRANIQKQIDQYEEEKCYAGLSEEDREALRIGREVLEDRRTSRKKRSRKMYLVLAATLILVIAMGITSIGGPEKIVQLVKSMVGDREVVKVNSSDENLIIVQENEEEAYQKIADEFGVEPVKIIQKPVDMEFDEMQMDRQLQVAELYYEYEEKKIVYWISATHRDSSWGLDVEDTVTDKYFIENDYCNIEVKEYETPETKEKRYSAKFEYLEMEYFLIGIMDREEFNLIINNLWFVR